MILFRAVICEDTIPCPEARLESLIPHRQERSGSAGRSRFIRSWDAPPLVEATLVGYGVSTEVLSVHRTVAAADIRWPKPPATPVGRAVKLVRLVGAEVRSAFTHQPVLPGWQEARCASCGRRCRNKHRGFYAVWHRLLLPLEGPGWFPTLRDRVPRPVVVGVELAGRATVGPYGVAAQWQRITAVFCPEDAELCPGAARDTARILGVPLLPWDAAAGWERPIEECVPTVRR